STESSEVADCSSKPEPSPLGGAGQATAWVAASLPRRARDQIRPPRISAATMNNTYGVRRRPAPRIGDGLGAGWVLRWLTMGSFLQVRRSRDVVGARRTTVVAGGRRTPRRHVENPRMTPKPDSANMRAPVAHRPIPPLISRPQRRDSWQPITTHHTAPMHKGRRTRGRFPRGTQGPPGRGSHG